MAPPVGRTASRRPAPPSLALVVALAALALGALAAHAAVAPTLDQVLAAALAGNPDLREARLRVDQAHADRRAAGALPNPTYSFAPGSPNQHALSLPADVGPQRLFRTRAASRGEDAARQDLRATTAQVAYGVRQAFYDLLLADSLRAVALDQEGIVRQLHDADSARVASGDLPASELARSALEVARAEAASARALAAVHQARLALQELMGVAEPDTAFTVSGALAWAPVDAPLDSLGALALRGRPDVAAAERRVEQQRAMVGLQQSAILPTPTISVVHQPADTFPNGAHDAYGVQVAVPLFDWNGAARAHARADLATAEAESARVRAAVTGDAASAADSFRTARVLAGRYAGGLLDQARAALDSARYGHASGARSLLELLDAVRAYGDTRSDYFTALHDYWVSAYAIDRAIGRDVIP